MPVVKKRNEQTETRLLLESTEPVELPPAEVDEKAILVQTEPPLNRALPHHDVVLFAPGKIHQRERKLGIAHHPQISLYASVQQNTCLCFPFSQNLLYARESAEKLNNFGRFL